MERYIKKNGILGESRKSSSVKNPWENSQGGDMM